MVDVEELIKERNKWRSKALMRENRIKELEAELQRLKGQGYE
jgi:hypothetical protein